MQPTQKQSMIRSNDCTQKRKKGDRFFCNCFICICHMLIKCPECRQLISDQAAACPHCGFPMVTGVPPDLTRLRRRRLPNGFGQITMIRGKNLRKPFRVLLPIGKVVAGTDTKVQKKATLYYASYDEAYEALVRYHEEIVTTFSSVLTIEKLYAKWSETYYPMVSDATKRSFVSAWKQTSVLWPLPVGKVHVAQIREMMDSVSSPHIRARIKIILDRLFDYAIEYELTDKNYARMYRIPSQIMKKADEKRIRHMPFDKEEMETLWKASSTSLIALMILIQCYSGWRPGELIAIKTEKVDLKNMTMSGGNKTKAGKNRIVPIHPKIADLLEKQVEMAHDCGSDYLFFEGKKHKPLTYDKYHERFKALLVELQLNPQHRPHDPRVHFVTYCKADEVDEYAIKYMVGHAITDLTERIYTTRTLDWLKRELSKLS